MLDIIVYPECLDCPYPDFKIESSEAFYIDKGCSFTNQRVICNRECTCRRIMDTRIDFTPYVEEAKRRFREYSALHSSKHDATMLEVMKPNAKRKMVKFVCRRCHKASDWHYSEKAAKRELDNEECE